MYYDSIILHIFMQTKPRARQPIARGKRTLSQVIRLPITWQTLNSTISFDNASKLMKNINALTMQFALQDKLTVLESRVWRLETRPLVCQQPKQSQTLGFTTRVHSHCH